MEETADRPSDSLRELLEASTTMIRARDPCAVTCRVADHRQRSRSSGRSAVVIPIVAMGRKIRKR
jgi:hypothetical protein